MTPNALIVAIEKTNSLISRLKLEYGWEKEYGMERPIKDGRIRMAEYCMWSHTARNRPVRKRNLTAIYGIISTLSPNDSAMTEGRNSAVSALHIPTDNGDAAL